MTEFTLPLPKSNHKQNGSFELNLETLDRIWKDESDLGAQNYIYWTWKAMYLETWNLAISNVKTIVRLGNFGSD
jgi:hypothetical protein